MLRLVFFVAICTSFVTWVDGQPFTCDGDFYLVISPETVNGQLHKVSFDGPDSINFNPLPHPTGTYINAIGYRRTDNYVYGINPRTRDLYRIGNSGEATFITSLPELRNKYIAGEVTPDGSQLIVQGGPIDADYSFGDTELVYIDLDPPYKTRIVPIETSSDFPVRCADIAFDPLTEVLYGFDGLNGRLVIIDPETADIDDTNYPAVGTVSSMASLFFDAFGNLYGYGRPQGSPDMNTLFKIDTRTGHIVEVAKGPVAAGNDGCTCPYTIELHKAVYPKEIFPCSEVTYSFCISNASRLHHSEVYFEDQLPEGFTILEVLENPYRGVIDGIGTDRLVLSNMEISPGVDSFRIRVEIGDISDGHYKNQAFLHNLPNRLGSIAISDDPATDISGDSTTLHVKPLQTEIDNQVLVLCKGDTAYLDATVTGGPSYEWSTGSTEPVIPITLGGTYWVKIASDCETFSDTTHVVLVGEKISVDLGPDQEIFLGEKLVLEPIIEGVGSFSYQWYESPGSSLDCRRCAFPVSTPKQTSTYLLEVYDEAGCKQSDELTVVVDKTERLYIPNVFSPNGDGVNDRFYITVTDGTKIRNFNIYSRWGVLLHHHAEHTSFWDTPSGWDGSFNGNPMPPGVYLWMVELEFFDGRVGTKSGDVTLVR